MVSRYLTDRKIKQGTLLGTASAVANIRAAYKEGRIPAREIVLKESQRLDQIAGQELQNSTFWWILAALSNIGWALQVPPGTLIVIPENVEDVLRYI